MKLKKNTIVILILLLLFVSLVILSISFPLIQAIFMISVVALLIIVESRQKSHKLKSILLILGVFFQSLTFIMRAFLPQSVYGQDTLYNVLQALSVILLGSAIFLYSRADEKTKNNFETEFASYFKHWNITLPQKNLKKRKSGTINKTDWIIKYSFGNQDGAEYLEVYGRHPGTWDRHFQILETGEIKKLPAFDDLQGITEAQLTADLKKKDLYPLVLNPWLVSYIAQNQPTKSRYEIDKYLLESGYTPGEIERAWDSLAPTAI